MTEPPVCYYCKKPLAEHVTELYRGRPRIGALREDGRPFWCSDVDAERTNVESQILQLQTLRRSLRYRASWIERRSIYAPDYLRDWAEQTTKQMMRLSRMIQEHF